VSRPAGGFVLWIELPSGTSGLDLHTRALAQGISIVPGLIFSAKQRFSNFIRISCGHPFSPTTARAIETLGRIAAELRDAFHPAPAAWPA
jgi:DNA-binding transcriptional MocR family regulator